MSFGQSENINTWISQINSEFKTAVSVDCVIFGYDKQHLRVLLLKSDMEPFEDHYSLVGDLVRPDENLDESANRILTERTGLHDLYMKQVAAYSDIGRHPLGRVITIAYYSLVKLDKDLLDIAKNNKNLKWKKVKDIDKLAFDHNDILDDCLSKLKVQLREKPIGFQLLPKKFTLKQLQNLYETVLDLELDKRNFRRKLNALNILIDLDETQSDVNHRPAKLYAFDVEAYRKRKRKGFNFGL